MQLSLFIEQYGGFWARRSPDLRQFIGRAAELASIAVMLAGRKRPPHMSPLEADPKHSRCLRSELQKAGLKCDVIGAGGRGRLVSDIWRPQ